MAATLTDSLQIQKDSNVLIPPNVTSNTHAPQVAADPGTVQVDIQNNTIADAYAYVTGLAPANTTNGGMMYLLQSDGITPYFPPNVSSVGQPLQVNCAIPLGAPGTKTTITIPYTDGGRIWIGRGSILTFLLNPGGNGPALVEPSVTNQSDPNYNLYWDFCEFTYNQDQLFVNLSCVDFACLPMGLALQNTVGHVSTAAGWPHTMLAQVVSGMQAQDAIDGAGWSKLVVNAPDGKTPLRVLSPRQGMILNQGLFGNYFDSYVDEVWEKYATAQVTVDSQSGYGTLTGSVQNNELVFNSISGAGFAKPSTVDIFTCNSGPFANYPAPFTDEMNSLTPRIAAAFNRATLLTDTEQPSTSGTTAYYKNPVCNHYSRVLHQIALDGRGYAFPYDDVAPDGGVDQSGSVFDPNPQLLTVTVGGPTPASRFVRTREMSRQGRQMPAGRRISRRDGFMSAEDEKAALDAQYAAEAPPAANPPEYSSLDLESGLGEKLLAEQAQIPTEISRRTLGSSLGLTQSVFDRLSNYLAVIEDRSPAYTKYAKPVVDLLVRAIVALLSLTIRGLISRVTMILFMFIFYLVLPMLGQSHGESTEVVVGTASTFGAVGNGTRVLVDNIDIGPAVLNAQ